MKKIVAILLSACLVAAILAGCGGTSTTTATETATADSEESTTVNTEGNKDANYTADESKGSVEEQLSELAVKSAPGEYVGDIIKIACSSGPSTFDPFARGSGYGVSVNIFEKLGSADGSGNFRLLLLKSLTQVDELTYECELWDFIKDSEGNPITAEDVLYSVEVYIEAGNQGGVAKLDHIEVTGDYTFKWINTSAFAAGEMAKQMGNFSIISKAAYEADPDKMASKPIGTGPYKLKEFMEGSYGIYEVNEDYWFNNIDDEEWLAENDYMWTYQNYKEIRCDVISDASARAIALENGSVDACTSLDAADVANYIANPDLGIITINLPVNPPLSMYFNCAEGHITSDVNLRQAICYAIDSAAVADGLDVPAYQVYGLQPRMYDAPESWTTGEGRDYYNYSIEKAKECLEKSSYDGEIIKVYYTDGDQRVPGWIMMQAQLKEIGINVELNCVEQSTMKALTFDDWDIASDTMGGGNYVPNVIKKFWSQDNNDEEVAGRNVCGVVDAKLDELYEAVLADNSEENINAWDEYFTNEMCYSYAVCCFATQTACREGLVPVTTGSQNQLTPGAFSVE